MSERKPSSKRQGRGTPDIGLVSVSRLPVSIPAPPHPPGKRLLACTVEAWETFWGSEFAGLVKPADHQALTRLFRMYDLRERFERILLKEPMTAGSMGQTKVNPAAAEVASLDGRILALEDRFGLSTHARLKLGITFGLAAKSLDEVNRAFDQDEDDDGEDEDPRLQALDVDAV